MNTPAQPSCRCLANTSLEFGRTTLLLLTLLTMAQLATAQSMSIFNDYNNTQQWNDAGNWSAGVPDSSTEMHIRNDYTIILPSAFVSAATARSLTIFDSVPERRGEMGFQRAILEGGTLNLTPLAINDSIRVGVASGLSSPPNTFFGLGGGATLTSTSIAKIGVGGPAGSGATQVGTMVLWDGSQWLHPAGLIEVGGGDGRGQLTIHEGLLAGSLLAGTSPDPRVVVAPRSALRIDSGGIARFSEVSISSFGGPDYQDWDRAYIHETEGLSVVGMPNKIGYDFETDRFDLGTTATGRAALKDYSDSRLGIVTISRGSELELASATAQADSIVLGSGYLKVDNPVVGMDLEGHLMRGVRSQLTIGNAGASDPNTRVLTLADTLGRAATLEINGSEVAVHGAAAIGYRGNGNVTLADGGVLDVHGHAILGSGDSVSAGLGSVGVTGADSVFRAQKIAVGASSYPPYLGYPSPTGSISVGGGGRVEVTGVSEHISHPILGEITRHTAGQLVVGQGGTIDILDGTGKVAFTDPTNGTASQYFGTPSLSNYGTIRGGGATAAELESSGHIDFGTTGGTLVNYGTIDPGHSPGWLTVNGDVSFGGQWSSNGNGRLLIELGGTRAGLDYDVFDIWGNADFTGGTLELRLLNGYNPLATDFWDFLRVRGTATGWFTTVIDYTGLNLDFSHGFENGVYRLSAPGTIGGGGGGGSVPDGGATGLMLALALLGMAFGQGRWAGRSQ